MKKSNKRLDASAEFFTPTWLVNEMLDKLEEENRYLLEPKDDGEGRVVLDPTCGNGQFIMGVIKRKVTHGMSKDAAIFSTYGSDLMVDNICDLIARIFFWYNYDIDIFDEKGFPIDGLTYPPNEDDHSVYWLFRNKDAFFDNPELYDESLSISKRKSLYKRVYEYNGIKVTVRQHPERWWSFGYLTPEWEDLIPKHNGMVYKWSNNFQIADTLTYDNSFDSSSDTIMDYNNIIKQHKANIKLLKESLRLWELTKAILETNNVSDFDRKLRNCESTIESFNNEIGIIDNEISKCEKWQGKKFL